MIKSNILKLVSYAVILSLVFSTYLLYNGSGNILKRTGLKMTGQHNIKTIEISKKVLNKHKCIYAYGGFDDKYIRINKIQGLYSKDSELYVINESIKFESLFQRRLMPYPGLISFTEEADPEFWPVQGSAVVENLPVKYYLFYADEQFRPCLHVADKIKYRAIVFFLYNNKKEDEYKVEYYVPNNGSGIDASIVKIINTLSFN